MTAQRKVRTDFDKTKEYSVNVSGCTDEMKKKVQQAFFDVGFLWEIGSKEYLNPDAVQYSNTTGSGYVTAYCMWGSTTKECNMTAEEFLDLVYEPEKKCHVHAELMAQFAEDAKTHTEPWKLWQIKADDGIWWDCQYSPMWQIEAEYRRKPKTHIVNGVEIPDLRITPKIYEEYCYPAPNHPSLAFRSRTNYAHFNEADVHRIKNGLCYETSEEGRQAAILHSKAMLGIA